MKLKLFISDRTDGSMKSIHDGDIAAVNQARTRFLMKHDIRPEDTTLVRLQYVGDNYTRYFTVANTQKGDGIVYPSSLTCDALVVTEPNHALFLPLADCIGAVLYDSRKNILMLSHLGRHNVEQYGGTKSVQYLVDNHGVDPNDLSVWLSPAAGKESYPLFTFDNRSLHEVAIEQLQQVGVAQENIEASSIDTAVDQTYYSHSQFLQGNREDDGRFAVVAFMVM